MQDYSPNFYSFGHSNVVDRRNSLPGNKNTGIEYC